MPRISVIVPIFNASNLIDRCLESLQGQTLDDFEIIFSDDGSTDNTGEKIQNFIKNLRPGINAKYIRSENNCGVARARNLALDMVSGDYIYSVDADDFIEKDTLETLYEEAKTNCSDLVSCDWYLEFKKSNRLIRQCDANTGQELFAKFAYGVGRWNLWLFLIKRDLIDNRHFRFYDGDNVGEDMMIMMKIAAIAQSVSIIHRPLYHYVQTNDGAISRSYKNHIEQIQNNICHIENFILDERLFNLSPLINQLKLSLKLPFLISPDRNDYVMWRKWFPESSKEYKNNPYSSYRIKLLEWAASNRLFLIIRLHCWALNKLIYGRLYK